MRSLIFALAGYLFASFLQTSALAHTWTYCLPNYHNDPQVCYLRRDDELCPNEYGKGGVGWTTPQGACQASSQVTPCGGQQAIGCGGIPQLPSGSYQNSCTNCGFDGRFLGCSCRTINGQWRQSTIDWGAQCKSLVSNHNGQLVCAPN